MRRPDLTEVLAAVVVATRAYRANRRRRIEAALLFDIPFMVTLMAIALLVRRLRGRPPLLPIRTIRAWLGRQPTLSP